MAMIVCANGLPLNMPTVDWGNHNSMSSSHSTHSESRSLAMRTHWRLGWLFKGLKECRVHTAVSWERTFWLRLGRFR